MTGLAWILLDQSPHLAHDAVQLHGAQPPQDTVSGILDGPRPRGPPQHVGHGCGGSGCGCCTHRLGTRGSCQGWCLPQISCNWWTSSAAIPLTFPLFILSHTSSVFRKVHPDLPAAHVMGIQVAHSTLRCELVVVLAKRIALRFSCVFVSHQPHVLDGANLGKDVVQHLLADIKGQVSDENGVGRTP